MLISAMFIIGGLLVIILSISGDIGDETTGSIAGTILFITGLIFLRRHIQMQRPMILRFQSMKE